MTWLTPAAAALVGALFAASVGARARHTRAASDRLWAAGLLAYALASVLEARAELAGWSVLRYRLYFLLAPALVGLLGAGTVHLAARRADAPERARGFTGLILALLAVAGLGQLLVPLEPLTLVTGPDGTRPLAAWGAEVGARAIPFPHPARWAFLAVNVLGGLALVAGAAWSGWRETDPAVLAIAAGALLPFAGGVASSAGWTGVRIPLQLAGVAIMYLGYQASTGPLGEPDADEAAGGAT